MLLRSVEVGNLRDVNEQAVPLSDLQGDLPDRLKKRL